MAKLRAFTIFHSFFRSAIRRAHPFFIRATHTHARTHLHRSNTNVQICLTSLTARVRAWAETPFVSTIVVGAVVVHATGREPTTWQTSCVVVAHQLQKKYGNILRKCVCVCRSAASINRTQQRQHNYMLVLVLEAFGRTKARDLLSVSSWLTLIISNKYCWSTYIV